MTALALISIAVILLGSIPLQLHLDTRRVWAAEVEEAWHGAEISTSMPEANPNLARPEPPFDLSRYPLPVTPMDLPGRWETAGRHRVGVAPGTLAQQARWNTPTGQFWAIVEFNASLDEPCSHCAAPEDGERAHVGCPGCSCPCGTALPEGVEGYAIAGRTR